MSATDVDSAPAAAAASAPAAAAAAGRKKRVRKPKATKAEGGAAAEVEQEAEAPEEKDAHTAAPSNGAAATTASAVPAEDVGAEQPRPKKRMRKPKSAATAAAAPLTDGAQGEETAMDTSDNAAASAAPAAADGDADGEPAAAAASSVSGSGYLSVETLNYYRGLADVLDRDQFQDEEDKQLFLENAMEELCGGDAGKLRAPSAAAGEQQSAADIAMAENSNNPAFVLQRLCSHAKCSHLVQKLLSVATPVQVGMFFTALQGRVVDVLADRYGSHVLESVLFRLPALLAAENAAATTAAAASSTPATAVPAAEEEARLAARQLTKLESAWRQLGTHNASSVEFTEGTAATLPLRTHFHALVAGVAGSWATLAQNAHASYSLRHIVHLLQGEQHIQAAAEAADNAGASGKRSAQLASPAVASSSSTPLPSYLIGLEELLPWIVQEWLDASGDDVEAVATNASGAPVLAALARSMSVLARAVRPRAASSTPAVALLSLLSQHQQALLAKLLRLEGADPDVWDSPEAEAAVSVAAKNYVTVLLQDRAGSRFLESVFSLGGAAVGSACFNLHMKGRLLTLAEHPLANYAVQHLLSSARRSWGSRGRHMLRAAFEELSPHIQSLCAKSRSAVVLKLLDAAVRLQVKENKLFKMVATAAQEALTAASTEEGGDEATAATAGIDAAVSSNLVGGLLLSPLFKAPTAEQGSISTTGSLIVQSCLLPARGLLALTPSADSGVSAEGERDEKIPPVSELGQSLPFLTVLNAFLSLPGDFLLRLATDAAGSRVFDAFVLCPATPAVKQGLLRRFQMKWVDLAVSGPGSFVLERLFGSLAPPALRTAIAGDLVRSERRVLGSRSGAVLHKKMRLDHFKRHQSSWLQSAERDAKKSKTSALFDDLLDDSKDKEKEKQSKKAASASGAPAAAAAVASKPKKEKEANGTGTDAAVKPEPIDSATPTASGASATAVPAKKGQKRSATAAAAGASSASAVKQEVDAMVAALAANQQQPKSKKAKTEAAAAAEEDVAVKQEPMDETPSAPAAKSKSKKKTAAVAS